MVFNGLIGSPPTSRYMRRSWVYSLRIAQIPRARATQYARPRRPAFEGEVGRATCAMPFDAWDSDAVPDDTQNEVKSEPSIPREVAPTTAASASRSARAHPPMGWWAQPMVDAMRPKRVRLGVQKRPLRIWTACSGTEAPLHAMQAILSRRKKDSGSTHKHIGYLGVPRITWTHLENYLEPSALCPALNP